MIDMNMIQSIIHGLFQQSGKSMLSKQEILAQAQKAPNGQSAVPVLNQVPEKSDYTEQGLLGEVRNLLQKGGVAGKIRSKIGV